MPNRRNILILASAAIVTLLGMLLFARADATLAGVEFAVRDHISRMGRTTAANGKLIFLAIDTDSVSLDSEVDIRRLFESQGPVANSNLAALKLMSQHWPWPRSVYAHVLDRLMSAGAKTVVFDLNFPSESADDHEFRAALARYGEKVVIGSNFTETIEDATGKLDVSYTPPTTQLIPQSDPPDSRVGFVNFWPDADGVIRSAKFRMSFAQFLGTAELPGEASHSSLAAQGIRKFGRSELIPEGSKSYPFRFTTGNGEGFPPRSIFEIFVPKYWDHNFASGAVFKDALVVIGASGNWQHDEHPTPFGVMSGPEIQLNVVNAILKGELLKELPAWVGLLAHLVAGIVGAYVTLVCSAPILRLGLLGMIGGAWFGAQYLFFNYLGVLGPVASPLIILGAIGFFGIIFDLVLAGAEQLRLRLTLQERRRAHEMLERANAELDQRVTARTADLARTNDRLISSLHEKDVLLKEVHHRVKNNLQVISSLLNLQAGYIKDAEALQVFIESRNRVRSMALIHEKLYQSQDLSRIDFEDYIKTLSSGLMATFVGKGSSVRIAVDVERIMLPVDSAVPCGLIVNELVTNCFKYAFKPGAPGEINISMKRLDADNLRLSVADNGVGFPKDLDFRNTESLGMQLVTTLADQLEGTITLANGSGTTFDLSFPEINQTKL